MPNGITNSRSVCPKSELLAGLLLAEYRALEFGELRTTAISSSGWRTVRLHGEHAIAQLS